MKHFKYIICLNDHGLCMFIFPHVIIHSDFYDTIKFHPETGYNEIVSAGFTDLKTCYGKSESLNVESRKEDKVILERYGFV